MFINVREKLHLDSVDEDHGEDATCEGKRTQRTNASDKDRRTLIRRMVPEEEVHSTLVLNLAVLSMNSNSPRLIVLYTLARIYLIRFMQVAARCSSVDNKSWYSTTELDNQIIQFYSDMRLEARQSSL